MSFLHKASNRLEISAQSFLQAASPNQRFYGDAACLSVCLLKDGKRLPQYHQGMKVGYCIEPSTLQTISSSNRNSIQSFDLSNEFRKPVQHKDDVAFIPAEVLESIQDTIQAHDDSPNSVVRSAIIRADLYEKARHIAHSEQGILKENSLYYTLQISVEVHGQLVEVSWGDTVLETLYDLPPESLALALNQNVHAVQGKRSELQGEMPVIFGNGWNGVWLHEAIGHALEADVVLNGHSPLSLNGIADIGKKIVPSFLTISDDPTLPHQRGSYLFDDEGTRSQCTTLIENGILRNYLTDQDTSFQLGVSLSGNARRMSFKHTTMPRMSNLCLANGNTPLQDLIADVKKGLYVTRCKMGEMMPLAQGCCILVEEGFVIEHGRLTNPVGSLMVRMNLPDDLWHIVAIGSDFSLEKARGFCTKTDGDNCSQTIPIAVGQPSVYFSHLHVSPLKMV